MGQCEKCGREIPDRYTICLECQKPKNLDNKILGEISNYLRSISMNQYKQSVMKEYEMEKLFNVTFPYNKEKKTYDPVKK